jgi:uncharacterized protein YkwD
MTALARVNATRAAAGLGALANDGRLNAAAAILVQVNAQRNEARELPRWQALKALIDAGYGNAAAYQVHGRAQDSVDAMFAYWSKDSSIQAQILDPSAVSIGFADTRAAGGVPYFTLLVARPPR